MPISMMEIGSSHRIKAVGGNEAIRRHLGDLGLVVGADVTVVNNLAGNLILEVRESRVALDSGLARRILV
ncbi:MAG: ferrous iron transport protein A [Kiritimatiellae bacterium]|nr:ferrous iron transport protein A [Kiritimatiellia bacterium]MBP5226397.1 ferrous iron transport protein A [Kiritimatiellia bacterium]